jgi:hypothetical protein
MNYPEYFTEEEHEEFHYDVTHRLEWKGSTKYCFAGYDETVPFFTIESRLSPELSEAYIKKVQSEFPMKVTKLGGNKYKFYTNEWSHDKAIILGNICKGISEFAFFCGLQILKYPNEDFFVGNRKAFEEVPAKLTWKYSYNDDHGWWNGARIDLEGDEYYLKEDKWKTTTIVKALELLPKYKPAKHMKRWDVCLGRA